ncbi:hypothetical protein [Ectopseudomonas guguanensis]|uniref:hypothetical protein n=1 Tax=Ectopseudomonas guguanensis TaxID=1198456 RepID=UPI0028A80364|nr:hypothetical protein [Pseudomonas guguanensis]
MAASGGMNLGVRLVGRELAQARLAAIGRSVDPVARGAVNTTATRSRAERYVKPLAGTIDAPRLRRALRVKRANSRRMDARIIPSSSGVLVVNYRQWGFDVIDATRARIWVAGPSGKKIAAGFVNPSSRQRLPLSTRSGKTVQKAGGQRTYAYQRALQLAQGPSVAYWFRQFTDAGTIRWTNIFLQQEFERRIRREIAKYSR